MAGQRGWKTMSVCVFSHFSTQQEQQACACMQLRRKEEAADHASADMARKVAALDQKDKSAAEKEQSLSSLTAELWAKASAPPLLL